MKAILVLLLIAVAVTAVIAFLRTKQVFALQRELERKNSALFDAELDYRLLKERCVTLCVEKPAKETAQYMAQKLSRLLGDYIRTDEHDCYLTVVSAPADDNGNE